MNLTTSVAFVCCVVMLYCRCHVMQQWCHASDLVSDPHVQNVPYMYLKARPDAYSLKLKLKGKHCCAPIQLYANSVSTFQILILLSGDVNPNPGPVTHNSASSDNDNSTRYSISYKYDSKTLHSFNSRSCSLLWREQNEELCNMIMSLGINRHDIGRKTHRGMKGGRDRFNNNLKLGMLNCRSVRNKSTLLEEFIIDH